MMYAAYTVDVMKAYDIAFFCISCPLILLSKKSAFST